MINFGIVDVVAKKDLRVASVLSPSSFSELESIFKLRKEPKGSVFVKLNSRNDSEYILVKGYCRSFLHNPDGQDITISFFKPQDVLPPHITRTRENQALYNLEALTDIELIEFSAGAFVERMIRNLELREFGNSILKNELMRKTDKEIALASLSAKDRLLHFRKEYSILENLIPHSMIASYLGVTNVSLSRLRSSLAKK